ncbi:MAG: hypothetical protein QXX95_03120 [Nitrososphaerales archaeon]
MNWSIRFLGKVKFKDEKMAKTIYFSLLPDNVNIPEGITLSMDYFKDTLNFQLSSNISLDTTLFTLNDLITSIQNGLNAISKVSE